MTTTGNRLRGGPGSGVMICGGRTADVRALQRTLDHAGLQARSCTPTELPRLLDDGAPVHLIAIVGDPIAVVRAVANREVPLLAAGSRSHQELVALADRVEGVTVTRHVVMQVQLDKRPTRLALAECVVADADGAHTVVVDVPGRTVPSRVPALRLANNDPFHVLTERRCRHGGPSTTLGLCWTTDQPAADVMLDNANDMAITARPGSGRVAVTLDGGRFTGVADRVQIGPNLVVPIVDLDPNAI